jgi:immune inhibitor A
MKNNVIFIFIIGIFCMAFTLSVSAIDNKVKSSADLGVINKKQIYYWLEKRGLLSSTATIDDKKQALAKYLGNKTFGYKKLPGEYGKKYMFAQQKGYRKNNLTVDQKSGMLNKSKSSTNQARLASTEAKVLALMIDFTDLKHDQNGNKYPASHYSDLLFANTVSGGVESVYQYYQHESGGTLNFTGTVQGWLSADNDAEFYGGNDENDDDKNVPTLVLEAITKAVAELNIDLVDYDLDNNGVIDHVMIFHSSSGEEAGGGTLGTDAIWSHSSAVTDGLGNPVSIPGSPIKLYGYTINPIDAQIGVVAHEFGHDLGVRDEYDGTPFSIGSPVANWSIMASGSWVDDGAHPSGFSPLAKDYFQNQYGGNWINQQEISFEQLNSETIELVSATNHQQGHINQVKINLPINEVVFTPYDGEFQFYSNEGHQLNNSLSFDVNLPAGISTLSMKAHWDIEIDYDYIQVLVNGNPITGNHTQLTNPQHNSPNDTVFNYISNKSKLISDAEGDLGWIDLTFDLSEFASQSVVIKITYITDKAAKGYGFVADNISVVNNNNKIIDLGAETNSAILNGFSRAKTWTILGVPHNYYVQLRSHTDTDKFLSGFNYDPGVLLWYRNDAFTDNDVTNHPGDVFIGVVDADQNAIKSGNPGSAKVSDTSRQIRDAVFSFFDPRKINGDDHLTANTLFDDKKDYSASYQPESGLTLPKLGLTIRVENQDVDSTTGAVLLTNTLNNVLRVTFLQTINELAVEFTANAIGGDEFYIYDWDFGDGNTSTDKDPNHTYTIAGDYSVTLTITDGTSVSAGSSTIITVTAPVVLPPVVTPPVVTATTNTSSSDSSGGGSFGFWLFGFMLILHVRIDYAVKRSQVS